MSRARANSQRAGHARRTHGASGASRSSVDRIQAALREKILAGVYPPGSRLKLTALAAEHQVSFIPVREALQRLEAECSIRTPPNRGARVAEISIADMRHICETRIVLETHRQVADELSSDARVRTVHGIGSGGS